MLREARSWSSNLFVFTPSRLMLRTILCSITESAFRYAVAIAAEKFIFSTFLECCIIFWEDKFLCWSHLDLPLNPDIDELTTCGDWGVRASLQPCLHWTVVLKLLSGYSDPVHEPSIVREMVFVELQLCHPITGWVHGRLRKVLSRSFYMLGWNDLPVSSFQGGVYKYLLLSIVDHCQNYPTIVYGNSCPSYRIFEDVCRRQFPQQIHSQFWWKSWSHQLKKRNAKQKNKGFSSEL